MNEKANYYMVIPASVWSDPELPPNGKLLYGHISTLTNKYGICTAENDYFAEQLGIKKDTVSRLVTKLVKAGYITVEVWFTETMAVGGRNIQLAFPDFVQGIGNISDRVPDLNPIGYRKNFRPNIMSNNTSNNIPPTPTAEETENPKTEPVEPVDDGFDSFWELYPRHSCKQDARKAWKKLKPSPDLQVKIHEAVLEDCRSRQWTKDNGEYIPYPSTWLNGRRWEDRRNPAGNSAQRKTEDRGDEW